jgi:hypothetical protein
MAEVDLGLGQAPEDFATIRGEREPGGAYVDRWRAPRVPFPFLTRGFRAVAEVPSVAIAAAQLRRDPDNAPLAARLRTRVRRALEALAAGRDPL